MSLWDVSECLPILWEEKTSVIWLSEVWGLFPSANNQFVHEIQIECNCVSSVLSMNIFMCVPGNRTQGFARDLDYVLWRYAQAYLKLTFGEILRAGVVVLLINIRWHTAGQHYMNTNRLEAWGHQQPLHFYTILPFWLLVLITKGLIFTKMFCIHIPANLLAKFVILTLKQAKFIQTWGKWNWLSSEKFRWHFIF